MASLSLPSPSSSFSNLDPASLAAAIEAACAEFERSGSPAAERFLVAFQQSSGPYAACLLLLAQPASDRARFTALTAMRDAMLREWRLLPVADVSHYRSCLLGFLTQQQHASRHVMAQAAHVLALLLKRRWADDRADALAFILQAVAAPLSSQPAAPASFQRLLAARLVLMRSLLAEFGVSATTPVGLSVSAHLRSHCELEQSALLPLFTQSRQLLTSMLASASTSPDHRLSADAAELVSGCLSVLEAALSWDFAIHLTQALQSLALDEWQTEQTATVVRTPPIEWRTALLQSQLAQLLVQAYGLLSVSASASASSIGCQTALQCLLHLASIRGAVFQQQDDLPAHLEQLIVYSAALLRLHSASPALVAAVSAVLVRILQVHPLLCLLRLPSFPLYLASLQHLTSLVLHSAAFSSFSFTSATSTELADCLSGLLGSWAQLVMGREAEEEAGRRAESKDGEQAVDAAYDLVDRCSQQVMQLYIDRRMQRRRQTAQQATRDGGENKREEEEEEEQFAGVDNEDEHLQSLAFLLRVRPQRTFAQFQAVLAAAIDRYLALVQPQEQQRQLPADADARITQAEQLLFLLRLLQYALTDNEEGGAALVPSLIIAGCGKEGEADIASVSRSLQAAVSEVRRFLSLLGNAVQSGLCMMLSPLLASCALSVVTRVVRSYVDVDTSLYSLSASRVAPLLLSADCARDVAETVSGVSAAVLLRWLGEDELHRDAIAALTALCSTDSTRPVVLSSPACQHLLQLYHAAASPLSSAPPAHRLDALDGSTVSLLVRLFLLHSPDEAAFASLLSPVSSRFHSLQAAQAAASLAREDGELLRHWGMTVAMLTGVADATVDRWFETSFAFLSSLFPSLLSLLAAVASLSSAASLVTAILTLFSHVAERQLSFMSREQSSRFMQACAALIATFLHSQQARLEGLKQQAGHSSSASALHRVESSLLHDAYGDDVLLALRLLSHVVRNDLQSAGPDSVERAGELCLQALSFFAADEMFVRQLRQPDSAALQLLYYDLLMDAVTTHTARLGQLQGRERLLQLAVDALRSHDAPPAVLRLCLQCVNAVSSFHLKQSTASPFGPFIPHFLRCLLHLLLFQHLPASVVDVLADALLPTLLVSAAAYAELSAAVIQEWKDKHRVRGGGAAVDVVSSLEAGFRQLLNDEAAAAAAAGTATAGQASGLSVAARRAFRMQLKRFISTTRAILQYR